MAGVIITPDRAGSLAPSVVNSASATIAAPAATGSQIIRVYKLFIVVAGATNITFQDGSTALTGPMPLAANEAIVLDIDGTPWFTTSAGNAFNIANSGTVQVSGTIFYMSSVT
jgi:hypothetical protein